MICGYVITKNEENNIEACLDSLFRVAKNVVVVDSESIDATCEIAKAKGATVFVNPFENYSLQRNVAISKVRELFNPEYIITLDADEVMTDEMIEDINSKVSSNELKKNDIFLMNLRVIFDSRSLKWGGFQRSWLPRLVKADLAVYENRQVNEHMEFNQSVTFGRLNGHLINKQTHSWEEYISKHNRYSTLESQARLYAKMNSGKKITLKEATKFPYLRRRWLRQNIWDYLPGRPALRFIQIYLVNLGILDGRAGFRRALFEAWQEMCTDLKFEELMSKGKSTDS